MSSKSLIIRQKKKVEAYTKNKLKWDLLKNVRKNAKTLEELFQINEKLQKMPRISSKVRLRNRCWKTGKARGFLRYFGLGQQSFRQLAHDCVLPGIIKASW